MKKIALLLSSVAVATSAFAVTPEVSGSPARLTKATVQPVQLSQRVVSICKEASAKSMVKSNQLPEAPTAETSDINVSYKEPAGLFALGLSENRNGFNGFSYRRGPAYLPLTWTNTSVGATEFEWEVFDFSIRQPQIITEKDLVRSEVWCTEDAPILYGMNEAGNSAVYQFGTDNVTPEELDTIGKVGYFFGGDCVLDNEINFGQSTYMYGYNGGGFTGVSFMQYSTVSKDVDSISHMEPLLTIPEPNGFGFVDPEFLGYANVFKTPAAPYLITKIWSWMNISVNKPTVVNVDLYKIDENGRPDFQNVMASGSLSLSPDDNNQILSFDLYALDEDGLETDEPIVIDSAFLAVMSFNNEDIATVYPVTAMGAQFPATMDSNPYGSNAMMLIGEGDSMYFVRPFYAFYADNTRTTMAAVTDWLWMVDATYPWTVAVDGENSVAVPVEGGTASFNVNSYISLQYFNMYYDENSDWIDLENATLAVNQDLKCEVLNIQVAALPEGVDGRTTTITLVGPGTELDLTINQGSVNAVSSIVVDKNAEYFDLQGRKVANPEKGLYIKKAGNKTSKVIL